MAICDSCKYLDKSDIISGPETGFYMNYWCTYHGKYVNGGYSCSAHEEKEGCFLTAACVNYLGKPDDCKELTALRSFRDTYMKSTEEGQKLVEEYYQVAPLIVEKINSSDKKELYYRYISLVIDKCVCLLSRNELEKTLDEYKSMVVFLKKETGV